MEPLEQLRRLLPSGSGVTDQHLSQFISTLALQRVPKGQSLPSQPGAIAGIVTSGCLRVYFTEVDGSDRVLYFAAEGWCLTGAGRFTADHALPLRIDALETTDVWIASECDAHARRQSARIDRIWKALTESTILTVQQRLVGGLRKSAAHRYLEFRRLYPDLDSRIAQYHVAAYLGVSPAFLSKLRRRILSPHPRQTPW